eukprot:1069537-Lingulodinium_polyedra.AAC.1
MASKRSLKCLEPPARAIKWSSNVPGAWALLRKIMPLWRSGRGCPWESALRKTERATFAN